MAGLGELLEVTKLFEQGRLKTVVDSIFPMKRAGDAQTKMERSRHFGKIVLRI
jgi:NADPH:quinone reductase-like Zn-dependent oxidoreductase